MTEPRSTAVFVDTSAFFALRASTDTAFRAARETLTRLARASTPLVTSNFVVAEAHALILGRIGRDQAARFLREIDSSSLVIIRASEEDEDAARKVIFDYADKAWSLTDAISFAIMRRLSLNTAFSLDSDFLQYGFQMVP